MILYETQTNTINLTPVSVLSSLSKPWHNQIVPAFSLARLPPNCLAGVFGLGVAR